MKSIISIIWVLSFYVCVQAAELTEAEQQKIKQVEQLMKQEFKDCLNAQINVTDIYDGLKDKNLETYSELPQIKAYYEALLTMISKCQKVHAFHKDVDQGIKLEQLVGAAISDLEKNNNMRNYCNARFDFCINYDKNFGIKPASDNGDGRVFYDRGGFKMHVFGSNNALIGSLTDELTLRSDKIEQVTYRVEDDNWGVLSGYRGETIVYMKIFLVGKAFNILRIEYPRKYRTKYNSIVKEIVASFKPVDLHIN